MSALGNDGTAPGLESVATFTREAQGFTDRHPDLNVTQASLGGAAFGMLRALMECPDCPGCFRRPISMEDWSVIFCRNCGGQWRFEGAKPPASKAKRKRTRGEAQS